jgi:hypothetical protein
VHIQNTIDEGQAETETAVRARVARRGLRKGFGKIFTPVGIDPRAAVGDRDLDAGPYPTGTQI